LFPFVSFQDPDVAFTATKLRALNDIKSRITHLHQIKHINSRLCEIIIATLWVCCSSRDVPEKMETCVSPSWKNIHSLCRTSLCRL